MKRLPRIFAAAAMAAALAPWPVAAGDGHDHGDAPPATTGDGPGRQPDGSVFLPKPAQRQLSLRTLPVAEAELPATFELAGRAVMDPNAGGSVQAALGGRLEAGPRGFPALGQRVRKGEVLAYVTPVAGALEQSGQAAQLAELEAARALARLRLARLEELADTVPRKEIEAAGAELASLGGRIAALRAGLSRRDALAAPVTGVIASARAVAGQMVDAREQVFEVVDPSRLHIEALAYDTAQARDVASASLALEDGQQAALRFIGAAHSLRGQALPLMFAGESDALAGLALGQPVRVFVRQARKIRGIPVPVAALLKNPSGQSIVWVKEAPERFEPRVVTYEPLDGASAMITSGLPPGERVVTQGASLLNQIR